MPRSPSWASPRLSHLSAQTDTSAGAAAPAASDQNSPQVLAAFVVTGSNIENAGEALSIPVAVLSPGDIQNSGVETNVLDVLRKISPAISGLGGENATISTGATNGGSEVSLHNLPTLVLINGRRMAYNPVDGAGGNEFVDLNTIPLADRKSTRLNSSHRCISYAVFC